MSAQKHRAAAGEEAERGAEAARPYDEDELAAAPRRAEAEPAGPAMPPAAVGDILAALGHLTDTDAAEPTNASQVQRALADPDARAEVPEADDLAALATLDEERGDTDSAGLLDEEPAPAQDDDVAEPQAGEHDAPAADAGDAAPSGAMDELMARLTDPPDGPAAGIDLDAVAGAPMNAGPVPTDGGLAPLDATGPGAAPQSPVLTPDAPAPIAQTPTPPAQEPATAPPAKEAPPAQGATNEDVKHASEDSAGEAALDIEWMNGLKKEVLASIDTQFSDKAGRAASDKALQRDPAYKALVAQQDRELATLRDTIAARDGVKPKGKTYKRADLTRIESDPEFISRRNELMDARTEAADEVRAATEGSVDAGTPEESVTDPASAKIHRRHGQMRARTDFMAQATRLFGSAAAVKKHYLSMRAVEGKSAMILTGAAATRYEAARAEFEAAHAKDGWTLPTTGTAMDMRRRHQTQESLGKLGHALGLAMDFTAFENPNLVGEKKEFPGLNELLVRRFGGGRAQMAISEEAIERMGKNTAKGIVDPKDQATLSAVTTQFNEVARTSQNFMNALSPAQKDGLQRARNAYFDLPGMRRERDKLRKTKSDPDRLRELERDIPNAELRLNEGVGNAFRPWTSDLQRENDVDSWTAAGQQSAAHSYKLGLAAFGKLDKAGVERTGALMGIERATFKGSDQAYRKKIRTELAAKKKSAEELIKTQQFKIAKRKALIDKLGDHRKIFGTGKKLPNGTWATEQRVSQVAVMQLIENGIVQRQGKPGRNGKTEMFNAEAVAVLAKYGFAPGSNFGDTMHFDFIEGYSNAYPGGRKAAYKKLIGPNGIVDSEE